MAVVVVVLGSIAVAKVEIETVHVGNPGNAGEGSGSGQAYGLRICGAVGYKYNIGKYEVTAGQYRDFLNAVAKTDTYGLYNTEMWSNDRGCKIQRTGSPGNYSYSVAADRANRPVNYVGWGDAARFTNWLHNEQPTGAQDVFSTEDGAYDLSATQNYYGPNGETPPYKNDDWVALNSTLMAVSRKSDWKWAITSEDEWYKAAYYDPDKPGGAGYYNYPTGSDTRPWAQTPPGTSMISGSANYWNEGYVDATYWTTECGAYNAMPSDSPCGTFDQGGNVWEWNEASMGVFGNARGIRGGAFQSRYGDMFADDRIHGTSPAKDGHDYLGFRVSEVPEPATLGMLALGGLAVLRRRSPGRRRMLRRGHGR